MKQQTQTNKIEWKEIELKELGDIGAGGTPSRTKPEYWRGDIPWLKISNLKDFYVTKYDETITEDGLKNSSAKIFKKGTIVISIFASLGDVAILNIDATTNQAIAGVYNLNKNINREYLALYLKSLKTYFERIGRGVAQNNINLSILRGTKIILPFSNGSPDLKEQERIVSILEKSEKLNKKNKNVEKLFDEYLKGVFYEMFGKIQLGNFDEEIIKIIDGDRGVNYPNGNDFSEKGYCLFLNTGNVRKNGFNFEKLMFITKEKDEQLRKGKAQIDDIILTTRGTIGNVALYNKTIPYRNIRINSGMVLLRTNTKKILPKFLEYLIQMPLIQNQFLKMNSGSAQPQLPITNLKKIGFPLPSLPLQQKFSKIVEQVEKMKEKINKTKQNSEELFNSLVSKGFRGEL